MRLLAQLAIPFPLLVLRVQLVFACFHLKRPSFGLFYIYIYTSEPGGKLCLVKSAKAPQRNRTAAGQCLSCNTGYQLLGFAEEQTVWLVMLSKG